MAELRVRLRLKIYWWWRPFLWATSRIYAFWPWRDDAQRQRFVDWAGTIGARHCMKPTFTPVK